MTAKLLLLLLSIFIIISCSDTIEISKLQNRKGVYYKINSDSPFTGKVVETHPNGQKALEMSIKNGKVKGDILAWHENGEKLLGLTYINGVFKTKNQVKASKSTKDNKDNAYIDYEMTIDLVVVPNNNFSIFFDGKLLKKDALTPFLIKKIKPGSHKLKIEKKGYLNFVKEIKIPKVTKKDIEFFKKVSKVEKSLATKNVKKHYGITMNEYISGMINLSIKLEKEK